MTDPVVGHVTPIMDPRPELHRVERFCFYAWIAVSALCLFLEYRDRARDLSDARAVAEINPE